MRFFLKICSVATIRDKIISDELAEKSVADFLPVVRDEKSRLKLRELMMRRIEKCSTLERQPDCPFYLLKSLTYASYLNLVNGMDHETMVLLLQSKCECAKSFDWVFK